MSSEEVNRMLEIYALGGLSADERKLLFEAALQDQDLFNRLAKEELVKAGFDLPENRAAILAALRQLAPSPFQLVLEWLRPPTHWLPAAGVLAAAAAAVVFGVHLNRPGEFQVALDSSRSPAMSMLSIETPDTSAARAAGLTQLFGLALQQPIPAQLRLNKPGQSPEYRVGEDIRFGLSVPGGGNCLLLDRLGDQTPVELFPNRFTPDMTTPAGQSLFVPPAGQGNLLVAGPPGLHRVRLVVVPAGVTLDLYSPASWSSGATVVEREYKVLQPVGR
jgi:hypothetical protein